MNILCLNTAFPKAQLVLEIEGKKVVEKELDAEAKASEHVMPAIDDLLFENSLAIKDIDVIGVVIGPGSFTGVRIGVALVKGLVAVMNNIKICGINSLDLMAYQFCKNNKNNLQDFCVVQNALGGRFFVKTFSKDGEELKENELVSELPRVYKVGLDCENLSEVDEKITLKSSTLLEITEEKIKNSDFVEVEKLEPVYLRLSQAEENLLKKGENNNA